MSSLSLAPFKEQNISLVKRRSRFLFWTALCFAVNELPKALTLDENAFQERYQFPKPKADDVVITSCLTNRRATWAARLLIEAGYTKVFVNHTGAYGWRFSPSVKPYDAYELGDIIPAPKEFDRESPDATAGLKELEDLGLLGLNKNESARSSMHLSADSIQENAHLEDSAMYIPPTSPERNPIDTAT